LRPCCIDSRYSRYRSARQEFAPPQTISAALAHIHRRSGTANRSRYIDDAVAEFPVEAIPGLLREQGRDPQITNEFIDALLSTEKDEKQAFTILALIRPDLNFKNVFHIDHLHPRAAFRQSKLRAAGIAAEEVSFYRDTRNWNGICNLSLLGPNENQSKGEMPLDLWVEEEAQRRNVSPTTICADLHLPQKNSLWSFTEFPAFIEETPQHLAREIEGPPFIRVTFLRHPACAS
jgi:hypothetical protein